MKIGYARISTGDQTLDLQRDTLKRAKCRDIYQEHASGKSTARPQLKACLKSLSKDDTLIVWHLDRLCRSLGDLIHLAHEFKTRGIGFASLCEQIDTRSPAGQHVFHVFGALAEFERNLIRERTLAGPPAAWARDHKGGRPRKLSLKDLKTVRALLRSGDVPVSTVAEQFRVARSTLYRNIGTAS